MRELAYHAGTGGANDIYVAAVDGSAVTAISHDPTSEVWPVWSPDGTRIAYDGPSSTQGLWQVVTVDPDGSNPIDVGPSSPGLQLRRPVVSRWHEGDRVPGRTRRPRGHRWFDADRRRIRQ